MTGRCLGVPESVGRPFKGHSVSEGRCVLYPKSSMWMLNSGPYLLVAFLPLDVSASPGLMVRQICLRSQCPSGNWQDVT